MSDTSSGPTSADAAILLVELSTDGEPKLYCPACNKALVSLAGYVKHVKKHEAPGGFTCCYCEALFCSDDELKKHRESEHTIIACRLCKDITFTNEVNYREHIRNVHKGVDREIFTCDKCGATYKTIDPYRRHIETECGRIKPYKCDKCPMAFVTTYNLKQHLDIHSCELKCCCSYCGLKCEGPAPLPLKKKVINFAVEDDDFKTEEFVDENEKDNFPLTPEQKIERKNIEGNCILSSPELLMSDKALQNQNSTEWSNDGDGEYVTDSKPADSDSDKEGGRSLKDFNIPMPIASIKQKNYDEDDNCLKITIRMGTYSAEVKCEDEEDHSFGENDRILDTTNTYSAEIKCENEECNLFDEKGRILESLVNENDNSEMTEVGLDKSNNQYNITRQQSEHEKNDTQDSDDIKEVKEVYIKHEVSDDREDILEEVHKVTEVTKANIRDGCVLPEGVTNCFPSLNDTSTVHVPRNVQSMRTKGINIEFESGEESKYRKYYRLAAISRKQLIERMGPNKSRQCPECRKIYNRRKPFEMHLRKHHKKSEDFIKQIFRNDLEKVSADIFKCHICDKVYLVEKRLLSHITKHGPDGTKVHKCSCCTLYFTTRERAIAHAHKKHKDLLWCRLCEKFMISYDALNSHKARRHGGNKNYNRSSKLVCTKCGKEFMVQTQLTNHERSDCGRLPLYQCQECGKSFKTAGILKSHMIVHNDARPYKCDKCGKTFKVKGRYENHIKPYHLDKRPHKCHLCSRQYPCRESLLTHMSEHTDMMQQAETRGSLPLNTNVTEYMGVQTCNILTSAEPQLGLDCVETRRFVAKEVITHDFNIVEDVDVKAKEFIDEDGEDNFPIKPEQKTKVKNIDGNISPEVLLIDKLLQNQKRIQRFYDGEDESVPDFEPADFHSHDDREDILKKASEVTKDDIRDCYVLLEDVTNWFPSLKNASTVNVPRNVQPLCSVSEKIKKIIEERRECRPMRTKGINTELESKDSKSRKYGWASVSGEKIRECIRRDKPRQCPECIKIYYRRKPFEMHLRNDHKKSEDFITQIFRNDLVEVSADVFKCHICDKVYLVEHRLLSHIPKHGPDGTKVHKCSCCTLYFTTREEATAHAHEKHKNLLWCRLCEKYMISYDALLSHKARLHGGIKNYNRSSNFVCTKCGKEFMVLTLLIDHERSDCGRLSLYQCQKCGKSLKTPGILKNHMLLHNDAVPYQCDKCGKTFKIKGRYKNHIKYYHLDKKRFKCELCPKEYRYRQKLLIHMSAHTDIKQQGKNCGPLPLNTIPTQMGVQKGNLLMSAKPEFDLDCMETGAFVAQDVITNDFDVVEGNDLKMKEFIDEDTFSIKLEQNTKMKIIGEKSILPPFEALMSGKSLQNQKSTQRSDDIENEYVPDIEQADSHSNEEEGRSLKDLRMTMSVASIKQNNYNEYDNSVRITTNIQIEHLDTYSADVKYENGENHSFIEKDRTFETMDTCSAEMKYEAEEYNLCDNNDRIFDHLLNKNDFSEFAEVGLEKSNNQSIIKRKREKPEKNDGQDSDDILKEAEVVYRKYEVSDDQEDDREDILEEVHKATEVTKDRIRDCYVLLEDVTNCFPSLKDTCTVKVPTNVKKLTKHGSDGTLVHECPCNCSLYFSTREEATAHAQQKHKNILWCELCEKFMTSSEALNSHNAQTHGGNMNYKCSRSFKCLKCGKKFRGRTRLTDHERSDCGRLPLYQCQKCGKCLTTARSLRTHILLHNDATPYQCDKCGKSFKVKAPYRAHIKYAHNEEKRYKCHLCPKQYSHRESLLTHMSLHTGIKRYKCNACDMRFSCVSSLIKHHRIRPETCGRLPLNTKATQFMGVQNGNLLIGAKQPRSDYLETRTFIANGLCPGNT